MSVDPSAVQPMKFEWIDANDTALVDRLLSDDNWALEQKLDGIRCMVRVVAGKGVRFIGHGGKALVQAAAAQHFPAIGRALGNLSMFDVLLDGEILTRTGEYALFDVPYLKDPNAEEPLVQPSDPLNARRGLLEAIGQYLEAPVRVVPQARFSHAKADLLEAVLAAGAEGVMFKHIAAPYLTKGERTKQALKLKIYRTVDCIVTARNIGAPVKNVKGELAVPNNAELAVYDRDGMLYRLGTTSMNGKPPAQIGDVVEVRYLSWSPGGSLVQPNLLRLRSDKAPEDCRIDQLVPTSRDVIEVRP